MWILLALVIFMLLGSGAVTLVEAAIFSTPLSQVHIAVERNRRGSRRLLAIKQNLQRPVAVLVILNNSINIGGSVIAGHLADQVFGSAWLGAFTAVFTLIFILLAEIYPKTLGERFALGVALGSAPALALTTRALLPVLYLIEKLTAPVYRVQPSVITTEEEIRILASTSKASGGISRHESELIRKAFRLNDVTAKDIMTHRLRLSYLPAEKRLAEVPPTEIQQFHSRILVAAEGDLDKINGVVHQRDILLALAQGKLDLTVNDLKTPIPFVYEATPAHRLLRDFQRTRQHLFVVVDEYGGTCGVVSLEDVLEELVGDIEDEMDAREAPDAGTSPRPREGSGEPAAPRQPA